MGRVSCAGGKTVKLAQEKSGYGFTCIRELSMVHGLQPNKEQETPGRVAHAYELSMPSLTYHTKTLSLRSEGLGGSQVKNQSLSLILIFILGLG